MNSNITKIIMLQYNTQIYFQLKAISSKLWFLSVLLKIKKKKNFMFGATEHCDFYGTAIITRKKKYKILWNTLSNLNEKFENKRHFIRELFYYFVFFVHHHHKQQPKERDHFKFTNWHKITLHNTCSLKYSWVSQINTYIFTYSQ